MGRLKNSPEYERHFQELRQQDDNAYDLYLEQQYLQRREELRNAEKKMSDSEIKIGPELHAQLNDQRKIAIFSNGNQTGQFRP